MAKKPDSWDSAFEDKPQSKPKSKSKAKTPLREDKRIPLGSYIPESLHWDIKDLSHKLSRDKGERITLADLVTEALEDLLTKHKYNK